MYITPIFKAFAPLHLVALAGKVEAAKMFIAAGADLEVAVRTAGDGQVGAVLPQMNQIVHK